jgi:chaperonin cofactor prefoldin
MITVEQMNKDEEELDNAVSIVASELMSAVDEFYKTDNDSALKIQKAWGKILVKVYGKE